MNAISFNLNGKTAHFRKPDVNSYFYATYNNIHKVALLGLLGAILGLHGYNTLSLQKETILNNLKTTKDTKVKKDLKDKLEKLNLKLPEFYEKLKDLKISIRPLSKYGYFSKKIQTFNNSVGYASKEQGGNLIVREQWLENPSWEILILDDKSEVYDKLKENLIKGTSVFSPYLGKNDHFANIDKVVEVRLSENLVTIDNECYIDSLFICNSEDFGLHKESDDYPYFFQEYSPISLQKDYQFYEYVKLVFTNYEVTQIPENTYSYDGRNYSFI